MSSIADLGLRRRARPPEQQGPIGRQGTQMNHSLAPIGRTRPPLAVLVAVSALQPFALNVLAPATPGLARTLGTDYATIQLTLTLYLVTVAVAQLVVGPISDRIGSAAHHILAGLALFGIGSLLGALADRIGMLLLAQIVQAGRRRLCAFRQGLVRDTASGTSPRVSSAISRWRWWSRP